MVASKFVSATQVDACERRWQPMHGTDGVLLYLENQNHFLDILRADLRRLLQDARSREMVPACRLNGTSDIPWGITNTVICSKSFGISNSSITPSFAQE